MGRDLRILLNIILVGVFMLSSSGCTFIFQKGRRHDTDQISKLKGDIDELQKAKEAPPND